MAKSGYNYGIRNKEITWYAKVTAPSGTQMGNQIYMLFQTGEEGYLKR